MEATQRPKEARPNEQASPEAERPASVWPSLPVGIPLHAASDLTVKVPAELHVMLTREAFGRLFAYVYTADCEVSCLGTVVQEGACFRLERFYLLRQTCSSSHTEIVPDSVAELVEKLKAEEGSQAARSVRAWAHSHPGMGLFWSGTDEATCRTLVSDCLVSLVVGNGFAVRCRLDLAGPLPITIDNVPVYCEADLDEQLVTTCRQEVEEMVSKELGMPDLEAWKAVRPVSVRQSSVFRPADGELPPDVFDYADWAEAARDLPGDAGQDARDEGQQASEQHGPDEEGPPWTEQLF